MSRVVDRKVAKRYASALFTAARKTGKLDSVEADLATLEKLWSEIPALRQALESPLVPSDRKQEIVDKSLASGLDPLTRSFLHLLIEKRRVEILLTVREEFDRQADEARGLLRAHAVVAFEMDDVQRAALVSALEKRTGKLVELTVDVDTAVIGGAVVRMGDKIIDGSVRGSLERLREQMLRES